MKWWFTKKQENAASPVEGIQEKLIPEQEAVVVEETIPKPLKKQVFPKAGMAEVIHYVFEHQEGTDAELKKRFPNFDLERLYGMGYIKQTRMPIKKSKAST